jgi:hypothetical protein
MKKVLITCLLLSSAIAQAMPSTGSTLSGRIKESTSMGNISIPLPSGTWTVVYAGSFEGPRMQKAGSDITGYFGEASNKFEELVLVQANGANLKSMLDVKFNLTNDLKTYADNLCTNKPAFYKDDYGTSLWRQKCLEVGSAVNAIDSGVLAKDKAVKAYISENKLSTPRTFVAMNYAQYDRDGSRIDIRLNENPITQGFDDQFDGGGLSQWNHEVISKYPQKLAFMEKFKDFAKSYAQEVNAAYR